MSPKPNEQTRATKSLRLLTPLPKMSLLHLHGPRSQPVDLQQPRHTRKWLLYTCESVSQWELRSIIEEHLWSMVEVTAVLAVFAERALSLQSFLVRRFSGLPATLRMVNPSCRKPVQVKDLAYNLHIAKTTITVLVRHGHDAHDRHRA